MSKVVLMTGATGFIGYNFALNLLELNYDVVNIINTNYLRRNNNRLIKLKKYSNFKEVCIESIYKVNISTKKILHLASYGVNSEQNGLVSLFEGNVLFTHKLIEYASDKKIDLLYFTTAYEYQNSSEKITINSRIGPKSPYAIFKYCTTEIVKYYCNEKKVFYNIFKLFPTYGPHEGKHKLIPGVITKILNNSEIKIKNPENVCDYLYIGDLIKLMNKIIHMHTSDNSEYIVSSGKGIKVIDIVNILTDLVSFDKKNLITGISGAKTTFIGDNSVVVKKFNWEPLTSLQDGLTITFNKFKYEL